MQLPRSTFPRPVSRVTPNGIQFSTYLKSRLLYGCTAQKTIADAHDDVAGRVVEGDGGGQAYNLKRMRFEQLIDSGVAAPAVNNDQPIEELNAALNRAGISAR